MTVSVAIDVTTNRPFKIIVGQGVDRGLALVELTRVFKPLNMVGQVDKQLFPKGIRSMAKDIRRWAEYIKTVRLEMNALAQRLTEYGATVEPEESSVIAELSYSIQFAFEGAIVTVIFLLKDHQTDSDVVITNMTTLPKSQCGKGFGSQAIQTLLAWATDNGLGEMRATQVSGENESFWQGNGFVKCQDPNPCNDFVHVLLGDQTY